MSEENSQTVDTENKSPNEEQGQQTQQKQEQQAPTVVPEDKVETPTEETTSVLQDTTKVGKLQKLVSDAGLKPSEVAKDITEANGEISADILKALVDKHGEAVGSLIAEKLTGLHKENVATAKSRDKAVYDQVQKAFEGITDQSGEETWKELSSWAGENIPAEQKPEINKLLQQGGFAAELATNYLVEQFKNSDGFTQEAKLVSGDSGTTYTKDTPLSATEYNVELNKLLEKGHVYGQSTEIAKLDARRLKAMKNNF